MFDFAWSEIALIAVVALIVIGPKELPRALRTVGIWTSRARSIAREFQSSLDQMIRESELADLKKDVEQAASLNLKDEIEKSIDPGGHMQRSLSEPLVSDVDISGFGTPPAPASTTLPDAAVEESAKSDDVPADPPPLPPPATPEKPEKPV